MQRRNINTSTRQLPVTTSSLLLSLHICIAAKYGSHGGGAQSLLGRNPIHDEWMFSPVRTGDRGFSVSWEGCHSKAWWAHQPVAVGQCLFVVWQPEGSFASCPPFGWLQAARVVQDLEGQPGQDWSPVEWLPDPKLHLLWQCHLWLLCLIFQVVTLLFWQPRAAQLKKEQEKQLANRKSYIGEIILDICKQIYIYIYTYLLCQFDTYFPDLVQPESLSGIGMHHTKARVALMHLLPLTWIHLRALACIHFPNTVHVQAYFGWQTLNAGTCLGVYALAAEAENWRQGDTDWRKLHQDFWQSW